VKTILSVKDKHGNIYSMPSETPQCILEVHYSTSYIQFIVQDYVIEEDGTEKFPEKDIIVPLNEENWIDFIAIKDSEIGEIVRERE
jgi:hypothetical protein